MSEDARDDRVLRLRALGEMAGGIAHEFNNMLMAIGGFARMARRLPDDPERVRRCLEEIIRATDRASGFAADLLAFGCPDRAGAAEAAPLARVVGETRRLLGPILGERVQLAVRGEGLGGETGGETGAYPAEGMDEGWGEVWVTIEPEVLRRTLVNLILNAREAMPDGGRIEVALDRLEVPASGTRAPVPLEPGAFAVIAFADHGVGIPTGDQDRIFDPFFTTKESGEGRGLGLTQVYARVRRAGGAVAIDSAPGRGTVVTLFLPVADPAPELTDAPGADPHPASLSMAVRVLLVEDEVQVRDFIRLALEDEGMRVITAADGVEALEIFATADGAFDLLITDLVMARMGGAELARRLRRDSPDLPVALISGYAPDNENLDDLLADRRRVAFLHKPIHPDELITKIRTLVV